MNKGQRALILGDTFKPNDNGAEVEVVGDRAPMPWRSDHVPETQYGYPCRFADGNEKLVWETLLIKMGGAAA
jgi:hypothetical protein